jgi:hypothetical protein
MCPAKMRSYWPGPTQPSRRPQPTRRMPAEEGGCAKPRTQDRDHNRQGRAGGRTNHAAALFLRHQQRRLRTAYKQLGPAAGGVSRAGRGDGDLTPPTSRSEPQAGSERGELRLIPATKTRPAPRPVPLVVGHISSTLAEDARSTASGATWRPVYKAPLTREASQMCRRERWSGGAPRGLPRRWRAVVPWPAGTPGCTACAAARGTSASSR